MTPGTSRTAGRTRWATTQIASWPAPTNRSLAWTAQLLASRQLVFASRTCANTVPACAHGAPGLEVVDTQSHQTLATSQRYSMLAVGDGRLWAANSEASGAHLVGLALPTLAPVGSVTLPGSSVSAVGAAAVTGAEVWAAASSTLSEISAKSLHVDRTLPAGGQITDLAASPNHRFLWDIVAISGPGQPGEVQLRNAATGAAEGTWEAPAGVRLDGLTADDTGAWVTVGGGMSTVLERLQGPPLRVTVRGGEPTTIGGQAHFDLVGQPISALDGGNVLWTDISGQALACITPTASATRSETRLATIGSLAATGSNLIAATSAGIDLIRPPAICT